MTRPLPELNIQDWQDTYTTLHMWTQIVGKLRLEQCPSQNHWWHVALYVTAEGLTTMPISSDGGFYEVQFDFLRHRMRIATSDAREEFVPLRPVTVADFYRELMEALKKLDIDAKITTMPQEVENPIPFDQDTVHASYDKEAVGRFFRILSFTNEAMQRFRSGFLGKVSPVHFFWGSFDMAVTRFSGRQAPPHPGGGPLPLHITQEAYSHECSSCGFWPGGSGVEAMFYSYAYPEPAGFDRAAVGPDGAFYDPGMKEYFLPYEDVRRADDPMVALQSFFETTYSAAATLGGWDRLSLERARVGTE
ncbi:MAG: hypothetical protein KIT11_10050 [Fimbriimonadaceae bacterium]|nr:hypothetical protein [Fimbriimonadaceae bacterium]QYK55665.1 MAG: hypothetical protein KF733_11720 [Fimbriimonadaceae bacterium]